MGVVWKPGSGEVPACSSGLDSEAQPGSGSVGPTGRGACSRRTRVGGPAPSPPPPCWKSMEGRARASLLGPCLCHRRAASTCPVQSPRNKDRTRTLLSLRNSRTGGARVKESKWVLARVGVRGVGRDGPRLMGRLGRAWGVGDRVRGQEGPGVGERVWRGWGRFCCQNSSGWWVLS